MHRAHHLAAALALAGSALLSTPRPATAGQAPAPDADSPPDERRQPPAPKWVVHSIEVSTKRDNPFGGRVTLRRVPGKPTDVLAYYWGGKCKKTKVPPSRLSLLEEAMEEQYAVEIPAFPIEYENAVIMCMQSIRVIHR